MDGIDPEGKRPASDIPQMQPQQQLYETSSPPYSNHALPRPPPFDQALPPSQYHDYNAMQVPPPPHGPGGSYAPFPVTPGPGHLGSGGPSGGSFNRMPCQQRKKQARATQACDACRNRKAKCDEGRPSCSFCRENSQDCVYGESQPTRAGLNAQIIVTTLRELRDAFTNYTSTLSADHKKQFEVMDDLKYRLQQLQIGQVGGSYGTNVPDIPVGVHKGIGESKPTRQVPEFGEQRASAPERQPSVPAATAAYPSQMQALSTEAGVGEIGLQVSRDVVTLSIPTKHTTAAHKLLRWSSIQRLMSPNPTFSIESYIMDLEEGRCLLDLYGQGGKSGPRDSWQPHLASPAPSTTSVNSEVQTFSPTTPLEDSWGKRFDRLNGENMKRMPHVAFGGLGPDGTLQIDRQTCDDLLKSYTKNIHILHPFLNMGQLKNTKDELARRYNATEYQGTLSHHHKPAAPPTKAIKRKHSTSTTSGPPTKSSCGCSSSSNSMFRPSLERSVSTALVLLVLALGKICQWKDPLPGSAPDRTQTSHQRTQRSPTLNQSSNYWNMASTPDVSFRLGHIGRVSSNEGLSSFEKGSKNLDAIPGLAYYAYATNILGNLHGSIDLTYVQANLLAGLYAGQLAHVIESWSWISTACRDLQVLLRPGKLNLTASDPYTDSVKLTFWTCLQLESDILGELDLPRSGITTYDHLYSDNGLPKGVTLEYWPILQQKDVMISYSAQLQLRVLLNRIHWALYNVEQAGWSTKACAELDYQLAAWRGGLPEDYRWSDTDPPSPDINAACMRAKYYGASYLIHRPFLHDALHPIQPNGTSNPAVQQRSFPPASVKPVEVTPEVYEASKKCVEAAIQSTIAFDGVHKRPIVTNIFGTAHAQFGNILVLAATYHAGLTQLISQQQLQSLFNRTIIFLDRLQPISPSLAKDAKILQSVQKFLFSSMND